MAYPERIVPDEAPHGIVAIHLKRYEFARRFCAGKVVVDAAWGVGHGSAARSGSARSVVGVDVDEASIAYAREHYARPNVEFWVATLLEPPLDDRYFEVIASFETIEHLPDPERF